MKTQREMMVEKLQHLELRRLLKLRGAAAYGYAAVYGLTKAQARKTALEAEILRCLWCDIEYDEEPVPTMSKVWEAVKHFVQSEGMDYPELEVAR